MTQEEVKKIYKMFKEMTMEEYVEVLKMCETQEEKEFYTKMTDFFLQKKQEEIINQPFKI